MVCVILRMESTVLSPMGYCEFCGKSSSVKPSNSPLQLPKPGIKC